MTQDLRTKAQAAPQDRYIAEILQGRHWRMQNPGRLPDTWGTGPEGHPTQRRGKTCTPHLGAPSMHLGVLEARPQTCQALPAGGGGSNSDLRSLTLSFRICTMGVMQWHSLASVRSVAIDTSESLHHYSVRVDGGGELGPSTSQVMHTHAHSARILSRHFLI